MDTKISYVLKKFKGNHKIFGVWIIGILVLDLVIGHFVMPREIKEPLELRNLNPYYNHGLNANVECTASFGPLRYKIFTNSLGMVDKSVREVKRDNKGKKRILFIGDSFTEGQGYPYSQTFVGRLDGKVDTNHVELLNAGVSSFSPKLYYLRTKYLIEEEKLKVDELFCFIDYSDIGDELLYEDFVPHKQSMAGPLTRFYRRNSIIFNLYHLLGQNTFMTKARIPEGVGGRLFYWTKTNNNFLEKYPDFFEARCNWVYYNPGNPTLVHAIHLAYSNMDSLNDLCAKNNIDLTVVVYPSGFQLLDPATHIKAEHLWQQYCQSRKVNFISLFDLFMTNDIETNRINRARYYIPNDNHWNAEGHKVVADTLYKYLEARKTQ